MLYRVEIVPGVSAAVVVVVIAPEAVGRISRLGFCSPVTGGFLGNFSFIGGNFLISTFLYQDV